MKYRLAWKAMLVAWLVVGEMASPASSAENCASLTRRLNEYPGPGLQEGADKASVNTRAGEEVVFRWKIDPTLQRILRDPCVEKAIALFDFDRATRFKQGPVAV